MSNVFQLLEDSPAVSTDVNALSAQLLQLKHDRDMLNKRIAETENALVEKVGTKTEGSFTVNTEHFKVTTTAKQYRKVDESGLTALRKIISRSMFNKVFRTKHDINLKELRYLENNEPETFAAVAKVITSTPGKTAVKVEALTL